MKIRSGFVSNSSSSSFVVKIKPDWWKQNKDSGLCINPYDYQKLIDYGFKKTHLIHASNVDYYDYEHIPIDKNEKLNNCLAYSVVCNQDEVIEFLTKNNIPFTASVHYGHYYLIFEKDSKEIVHLTNYGGIAETYGLDHLIQSIRTDEYKNMIIQRVPLDEYEDYNED